MHTFAHVEIPVRNLKRASTFYGALFQWRFEPFYGDDYLLISTAEGQVIGGLSQVNDIPLITDFFSYVEVGDLDRALQVATTLGGQVIRPKTELPGSFGSYAVIQSPDGYNLGLWTKVAE